MTPSYPEFKGKRALITGGTQGIGKAIAERLGRQGAMVYLNFARNEQAARETLDQFRDAGYASELFQADLGSPEAIETMLEHIHQSGPLDLLVCNAAYCGPIRQLSQDSEVGKIVLVLVVVLVLDLCDFGAEKRARSFGNYFVPSL